ncbi:hypothetical protein Pcinc_038862 [Petrolisthes cinctipes]|uniref:Uncharacterized protein n=1 Tax=Petrolisthes cinctipes TaxID=88211 RepID=A0AAE1BQX7_PETCI|nr:hypothetical protein Pcinc_038862 [Petrolisthes cinctipes]
MCTPQFEPQARQGQMKEEVDIIAARVITPTSKQHITHLNYGHWAELVKKTKQEQLSYTVQHHHLPDQHNNTTFPTNTTQHLPDEHNTTPPSRPTQHHLPDQHNNTTFPTNTTTPPSRPTQHHLPDQNNNITFPTNTAPPHLLDQLQLPESVVKWHGRVPQHLQEAIHSPDDVGEALFLIGVERVKGRGGGVPFEGSVDVGSEAGQATLVHRHTEERREKRYRSLTKEVVREGRKGREYWRKDDVKEGRRRRTQHWRGKGGKRENAEGRTM